MSCKLYQFIKRIPEPAKQTEEIKIFMGRIWRLQDERDLGNFLIFCTSKLELNAHDQNTKEFFHYISAQGLFHEHLVDASHLDINDMINSLTKEILKCLHKFVQSMILNELSVVDSNWKPFMQRITSYEWVRKLTDIQAELSNVMGKRSLSPTELSRILDVKQSSSDFEQILPIRNHPQVIDLLSHYAKIYTDVSINGLKKTLTIRAANLSLQDVLRHFSDVKEFNEIYLFCADCFYIDRSIDAGQWASKNVAICSPKIFVIDECVIDVSGRDGAVGKDFEPTVHKREISSERFGHGISGENGAHGTPGGSGGNILIQANKIVNPELLTLISCGANGGDGQDGGDGGDGVGIPSAEEDLKNWPKDF